MVQVNKERNGNIISSYRICMPMLTIHILFPGYYTSPCNNGNELSYNHIRANFNIFMNTLWFGIFFLQHHDLLIHSTYTCTELVWSVYVYCYIMWVKKTKTKYYIEIYEPNYYTLLCFIWCYAQTTMFDSKGEHHCIPRAKRATSTWLTFYSGTVQTCWRRTKNRTVRCTWPSKTNKRSLCKCYWKREIRRTWKIA